MRGRRAFLALGLFVIIHSLFFLAFFSFELIPAFERMGTGANRLARVGRNLFKGFIALLAVLVALFTPAFTATALSQERDKRTLDFLCLTLLTPFQIVTGKLVGAFLYVNLLIVTSLPILGVVFFVGGVDLHEVLLSYVSLGLEALIIGALCIGLSAQKQTGTLNSALAYLIPLMGLWAIVPIVVEGIQVTAPWYGWSLPVLIPAIPIVIVSALLAMHEAASGLKITAYDKSTNERVTALIWYVLAAITVFGWIPWTTSSMSTRNLKESVAIWYMLDGLVMFAAFGFYCFARPSRAELEWPGIFVNSVPSKEFFRNRLENAPWFLVLLTLIGSVILMAQYCMFVPSNKLWMLFKLVSYLTLAKVAAVLAYGYFFVSITYAVRLISPAAVNGLIRIVIIGVTFFTVVFLPLFVMLHFYSLWADSFFTFALLCLLAAVSPFGPLLQCHENMAPRPTQLALTDLSLLTQLPPWVVYVIVHGLFFAFFIILARRLKSRVAKQVLGKTMSCIVLALTLVAPLGAEGLNLHLKEGLGSVVRSGSWYQVEMIARADVEGYSGDVSIVTNDGEYIRHLSLPPRGTKRLLFYVQGRRYEVKAEGLSKDDIGLFARQNPAISTDSFFVVLISPKEEHGSLDFLKLISPSRGSTSAQTVVVPLVGKEAPNSFLGYDGVDIIVLGNEDFEQFTNEQNNAIEQWVLRGGTLIVPAGVKPERFRRWPLRHLFPCSLEKTSQMSSISDLANQFRRTQEDLAVEVTRPFLVTDCVPGKNTRVLYRQGNKPLVVEGHQGAGRVICLSFDVAKSPLALQSLSWLRLRMWRMLMPWRGFRARNVEPLTIAEAWSRHEPVPFSQVKGELVRQALRIDTVEPPSATLVFFFVLSYVILVGPVQYIWLRRLQRLEWAWIGTPLVALLYFCVAFIVGSYRLGGQRICRQLTILSGKTESGALCEDSFLRLFTDRTATYLATSKRHSGLVVPAVYSYRKKEKFTIDGKGINAGPAHLHVWSERDYVSFGLRKNDFAVSGDFVLDGPVLSGSLVNNGTTTLRRLCLMTARSYTFLPKKFSSLAPGQKHEVTLQLRSLKRKSGHIRVKNLKEFESSRAFTELIEDLDPTELYLLAFVNDNFRSVEIHPKPDRWDHSTVLVLKLPMDRRRSTAYIHSPNRVRVWCRYEERRRKSKKKRDEKWTRFNTNRINIDSSTRLHLRVEFPELPRNVDVEDVEVTIFKRRGSCEIGILGPDNYITTERFTSWRDDRNSRVFIIPKKMIHKDGKIFLSIETDGHSTVTIGNIRFVLQGRKRVP